MITIIDDPFDYPVNLTREEWLRIKRSEYQRRYREKKRGGPPKQWGGKRPGAGRKPSNNNPTGIRSVPVILKLSRIQVMLLLELGTGTLTSGIQAFIDKNL